jgi:hypothetical protein
MGSWRRQLLGRHALDLLVAVRPNDDALEGWTTTFMDFCKKLRFEPGCATSPLPLDSWLPLDPPASWLDLAACRSASGSDIASVDTSCNAAI